MKSSPLLKLHCKSQTRCLPQQKNSKVDGQLANIELSTSPSHLGPETLMAIGAVRTITTSTLSFHLSWEGQRIPKHLLKILESTKIKEFAKHIPWLKHHQRRLSKKKSNFEVWHVNQLFPMHCRNSTCRTLPFLSWYMAENTCDPSVTLQIHLDLWSSCRCLCLLLLCSSFS